MDKIRLTSEVLLKVTKSGLERPVGLYFPSHTVSLTENGCIELSNSEKIAMEFFKSDWSRSYFLVPLGHSSRPNKTTLYFLGFVITLVELICWIGGSGLVASGGSGTVTVSVELSLSWLLGVRSGVESCDTLEVSELIWAFNSAISPACTICKQYKQ